MKKAVIIIGAVISALILNCEIYSLALLAVGGCWLVSAVFKGVVMRDI